MIQPLKSLKKHWFLYWMDLEEPLPDQEGWFLPTILIICDQNTGAPIAPPEIFEELDQAQVENFLYRVFEQVGVPDLLSVAVSEDWNTMDWKNFARDCKFDLQFQTMDRSMFEELSCVTKTFFMHTEGEAQKIPQNQKIARALVQTALRMQTSSKKIALLKLAIARDSDCVAARIELADMDFHAGNFKACLLGYETIALHEESRWKAQKAWWTDRETRPYLRSLYGSAMTQWHFDRYLDAATILDRLLSLNPQDHQGARFLVPMLYLLAEMPEMASVFFTRYQEHYPNDFPEPAFLCGWALCLSLEGHESAAREKYAEAILKNIYLAPMLLEEKVPQKMMWFPNDLAEPSYALEFIESYAVLWDREAGALRLFREVYHSLLPRIKKIIHHREKMLDFHDQRFDPDYKTTWGKLMLQDNALIKL